MRGSAASFPRLTPPLNLPRRPPDACKTHPESIRARFGSDRCGANAVHGAKSVAEVERQLAFLRAHFAGFEEAESAAPAPAEEAHVAEAESKWVSPEEEEFAEIDRTSRVVWEGEGGVRVTLEAHASRSHHTGLRLWPAADRLSRILCADPSLVRGRRVLELGAGCGLVSAVAATLGGAVTATDRAGQLPHLEKCAALGSSAQRFACEALEWGDGARPPPWAPGRFDVILGSDITYVDGDDSRDALIGLVRRLVGESASLVLLCHHTRNPAVTASLWRALRRQWPGACWVLDGRATGRVRRPKRAGRAPRGA